MELSTVCVASLLFLVTINIENIAKYFGIYINSNFGIPSFVYEIQDFVNNTLLPVISTALVWAMIGLGVYVLIWIIMDSLSQVEDMRRVGHRFIFPSEDRRRLYEYTIIGHILIRAIACLLLILWIALLFKVIPAASHAFFNQSFSLYSPLAVFAFGIYLYLVAPISRMIALRPRLFSS